MNCSFMRQKRIYAIASPCTAYIAKQNSCWSVSTYKTNSVESGWHRSDIKTQHSARISSRLPVLGASDVGPINVWPQILAAHYTAGFSLDVDGKFLSAELAVCDVSQMTIGRSASCRELVAVCQRKRLEVCLDIHASQYIHRLVDIATPMHHRPGNSPDSDPVA